MAHPVPQPAKWQRIGNQIDAAMIFPGPDFVNVCREKELAVAAIGFCHSTPRESIENLKFAGDGLLTDTETVCDVLRKRSGVDGS